MHCHGMPYASVINLLDGLQSVFVVFTTLMQFPDKHSFYTHRTTA